MPVAGPLLCAINTEKYYALYRENIKNYTLIQVVSCEFFEIFKSTYFVEHL